MKTYGIIFDLGETLITNTVLREQNGNWGPVRARMAHGLAAHLIAEGWLPISLHDSFQTTFLNAMDAYDTHRQMSFLEYSTDHLIEHTLDSLSLPPPPESAMPSILHAFYAESETWWQEMPDAIAILQTLQQRGYRLGLVSNAMDGGNVRRLLAQFLFTEIFDPIIISAEVGIRKPNPRIYDPLLAAWDVTPDQVAMVGDTLEADILGANRAGIRAIWLRRNGKSIPARAPLQGENAPAPDSVPDVIIEKLITLSDLFP